MASAALASPISTSQLPALISCLLTPLPMVALPWGSRSTSSTRRLVAARDAARLMAVVVLPTPPFWFVTARILPMDDRVIWKTGVEYRTGYPQVILGDRK